MHIFTSFCVITAIVKFMDSYAEKSGAQVHILIHGWKNQIKYNFQGISGSPKEMTKHTLNDKGRDSTLVYTKFGESKIQEFKKKKPQMFRGYVVIAFTMPASCFR